MIVAPHSFKVMHLSHAVDNAMQLLGKDLHMEHSFCLQTTIGGRFIEAGGDTVQKGRGWTDSESFPPS